MTLGCRRILAAVVLLSLVSLFVATAVASAAAKRRQHAMPLKSSTARRAGHRAATATATLTPTSQGKASAASSCSTESSYTTRNGNDGRRTTSWLAGNGVFPQWWQVDLGSTQSLTHIRIAWRTDRSQSYGYQLLGSTDGASWTTLLDRSTNTTVGTTDDQVAGGWRFVRVRVTSASASWAGFWECQVFTNGAALVTDPSPPPSDSPTVTPTPATSATPTPAPSVSASPTPSPSETPLFTGSPCLVLRQDDIDAIKARLAAGLEPESSAWKTFLNGRAATAAGASPSVFAGPFTGPDTDAARTAFDKLGKDGSYARDLALAYAFTGDAAYARKARAFLVAWAQGNTPTTIDDYDSKDTGQLQTYGDFSFAYAYDLTYDSGVYTAADRGAIASWFRRSVDALQSCLRPTLTDYFFTHPDTTTMLGTYEWDASKHYSKYDALIVGADFPVLMNTASLAMAHMAGYTAVQQKIMDDASNPLNIEKMEASALTPHNDGDGAGTARVPQEKIYKSWSSRGGMFDYMTYNTRVFSVIVDMATNLGWSSTKVTAARAKLHTSWSYMARFFGPDAESNFNPTDQISLTACLPRFTLALHDFGDASFGSVVCSGDRSTYYEPQLLGPVTLTHSVVEQ